MSWEGRKAQVINGLKKNYDFLDMLNDEIESSEDAHALNVYLKDANEELVSEEIIDTYFARSWTYVISAETKPFIFIVSDGLNPKYLCDVTHESIMDYVENHQSN